MKIFQTSINIGVNIDSNVNFPYVAVPLKACVTTAN
jgi:hypothetical protein